MRATTTRLQWNRTEGAATGVGGVIRDILSAGTRPIAILDGLRFGDPASDPRALWLFKNAVTGIADYGNCLGIPTIGGEIEFDQSYSGYAMVDVASVGFGKRERLIKNHANAGDAVMLIGGSTGRDGIGGSQFASDSLEDDGDRSAVQIPDPFMEKMLIEAILEARDAGVIHAMKDLGGGGLSCAISETADALGVGIDMDASAVHVREPGMAVEEIMTSESQERMLIITDAKTGVKKMQEICTKFEVPYSVIGSVSLDKMMRVSSGEMHVVAEMPADVVANARLLSLPSSKPSYLDGIEDDVLLSGVPNDHCDHINDALYRLLTSPNIASRRWVYGQYDHEVGIRTIVRPGADASVLRLDNGAYLAVSMDGNPKHCYVNPRQGAIGCFEEACRNVVCTGAEPIGMLDHLQFGDPNDPEIFWTFMESVQGIADFAKQMQIPCIGGKVSLYNETQSGPIKPTPVIAVIGLLPPGTCLSAMHTTTVVDDSADKKSDNNHTHTYAQQQAVDGDWIIVVGTTKNEMGGSEYHEYIRGVVGGGRCPAVNIEDSRRNSGAILDVVRKNLAHMAHDCSKGGLAVAVSEVCLGAGLGCEVHLGDVPYTKQQSEDKTAGDAARLDSRHMESVMFSETHSRYLIMAPDESVAKIQQILSDAGVIYGRIGRIGGDRIRFLSDNVTYVENNNADHSGAHDEHCLCAADLSVDKTRQAWSAVLGDMIHNA